MSNLIGWLRRRQHASSTPASNSSTPRISLEQPANETPILIDIKSVQLLSDLVILVMGAAGGGKSSIINVIVGSEVVPVHEGLNPSLKFEAVRVSTKRGPVVFIEVPEANNMPFLLLYQRYNVIGVIFIHKLSDTRIAGDFLRDFNDIKQASRDDPFLFSQIVCVTSHWSSPSYEDPEDLQNELNIKTSQDGWAREGDARSVQFRRFALKEPSEVKSILDDLLREEAGSAEIIWKECGVQEVYAAHWWKIFVVMGVTGAGKSNFIAKACNNAKWNYNDASLESSTSEIQAYKVHINGHKIILVDTPGFDDTKRSDFVILKTIADWLEKTFRHKILLDGLIYFHRISDNRIGGSALQNIKIFQQLAGKGIIWKNVRLVTTMWDQSLERDKMESREMQLRSIYWKDMIRDGAGDIRFLNTHKSAKDILKSFRTKWHQQHALQLQEELVNQRLQFQATGTGRALLEKLTMAIDQHSKLLMEMREQGGDFDVSGTDQYKGVMEQVRVLEEDIRKLHLGAGGRLYALMRRWLSE